MESFLVAVFAAVAANVSALDGSELAGLARERRQFLFGILDRRWRGKEMHLYLPMCLKVLSD